MAELKTFLFTDIAGSVRLKNEMSGRDVTERDRAFIDQILKPHRKRIEDQLREFSGRVVSTAGDGHFLVFENTVHAALWAVAVQRSHAQEPIETPDGSPVEVRISIHAGVPQVDPGNPDNFIGKSVDYASRLNDYTTGGQILVSRSVMAILHDIGLEGLRFHHHGRRMLKGIGDVDVHELLYDDRGPRPMRKQPKTNNDRQWTVVPTVGFNGDDTAGRTSVSTLRQVGNYELEEQIGSGGMGDVYKARHVQFGRVRAVKVIKPQFVAAGHGEVIGRFYNEIKAAGRLEHKNIVVAIDSSSPTDSVHYLVMEYIDGVSLDELAAGHGPLPIAESCEIIRQAARGLQYIHKNDMVHRDIKPSNLMLTLVEGDHLQSDSTVTQTGDSQRAVVKILDLGLALLATDPQDRFTRFDLKAMGTGMYMPPEQWKSTSVDIRADIYSLGCTLYHLLAGNPPFYDSDLRPEKAHEKSPLPPIRTSLEPIPKKLWEVVRKMLEKRPEHRFSTPAEVAQALLPFAEGHSLPALVRRHMSGSSLTGTFAETKPDAHSGAETHRSRPWGRGVRLRPSRRWLVGTALPWLLILAFLGGVFSLLNASRRDAVRRAEQDARASLASAARLAAVTTLPEELRRRFAVLTSSAQQPELAALVRQVNEDATDEQALAGLDTWIANLAHRHGNDMVVNSWFINNRDGIQVARSPYDKGSVENSYKYRDYFHGLPEDIREDDAATLATVKPIEQPHLSRVYQSSTSNLLKVAFSAPIRDQGGGASGDAAEQAGDGKSPGGSSPGQVIGVLAMSVNVHEFEVLDQKLAGGGEVVLIDLRDDWVNGMRDRGLILHHPKRDEGKAARIDKELLAQIDAAHPLRDADFDGADHFLAGYRDPLSNDPLQKYWGVFEPVRCDIGEPLIANGPSDRIGWVVLVQRPMIE